MFSFLFPAIVLASCLQSVGRDASFVDEARTQPLQGPLSQSAALDSYHLDQNMIVAFCIKCEYKSSRFCVSFLNRL